MLAVYGTVVPSNLLNSHFPPGLVDSRAQSDLSRPPGEDEVGMGE
jgi:hypothetical protein